MRYTLFFSLSVIVFLVGCSHRIKTTSPSDEELSCLGLLHEMSHVVDIMRPLLPNKYRIDGVQSSVVEGTLEFPTWSLLDFSGTDREKIDAYRMRYNDLARRYNSKNCSDIKKVEIPLLPN